MSPRDVCRLSLLCSPFRSVVEWDVVRKKFLPPDDQNILVAAEGGGSGGGSNRDMYMRLCNHPLIIDGGNKVWLSFIGELFLYGSIEYITCYFTTISKQFSQSRLMIREYQT